MTMIVHDYKNTLFIKTHKSELFTKSSHVFPAFL